MNATRKLRQILNEEPILATAGAFDALSAKIIQQAGFRAIYTTGFGIAGSHLGKPDVELYSMNENLTVVGHMAMSVDIPIIADLDTGYGNAVNVIRTIQEFERVGCAGGVLEDQLAPKRCPACDAAFSLVPLAEGIGKIRAAVDTKNDPDFMILARTDATGRQAVERANAYFDAGADMVVLISRSFESVQDLKNHCQHIKGPLCVNIMEGIGYASWLNDQWTMEDLIEVGVKIVNYPLVPLFAAVRAMLDVLAEVPQYPTLKDLDLPRRISHEQFMELIGFKDITALQEKYMPSQEVVFGSVTP